MIDSSTNYISFILTAVVHVWEEGKYIFYYSRLNPRELANTLYHIEHKVQFLTLSLCIHFDHAHKYACKAKPESNVNPKTNSELSKTPFEVKSQMSLLKACSDRLASEHTHTPCRFLSVWSYRLPTKVLLLWIKRERVERGWKSGMKIKETEHILPLSDCPQCKTVAFWGYVLVKV